MALTLFGQIMVGILGTVGAAGILWLCAFVYRRLNRADKLRTIYYTKMDCMIEALGSIPNEIGKQFKKEFKRIFEEKMEEQEFINKT